MSSIASTRYTSLRLSLQSKRKNIDSSQGKNNSDIRHFKLNLKFLKSSSFMSHYVIWLFAWQTQKFYKFWKYKILEYIRLCVIWLLVHAVFNTTSIFSQERSLPVIGHMMFYCTCPQMRWGHSCVFSGTRTSSQARSHSSQQGGVQKEGKHCPYPGKKFRTPSILPLKQPHWRKSPIDVLNYSQKNWGLQLDKELAWFPLDPALMPFVWALTVYVMLKVWKLTTTASS